MNNIAVLEVGTSKITVLFGKSGINGNFNIAGTFETPYAGYYEGEFVEEEELNGAIKTALSKAELGLGEQINKLYVGVPSAFSASVNTPFSKTFSQKVKINEEILNSIYDENNQYKDVEDYVLITCAPVSVVFEDGRKMLNPIGQRALRVSGILNYIYSEKNFILKMNQILSNYGIAVVEYLSSPLCEAIYLLPENKRETGRIIIDCGFITTSVAIAQGNGLTLLGSFSVGGGQITSDLCQCLNIGYKEAENLKKQLTLSVIPNDNDIYQINRIEYVLPVSMKKANEIVCSRLDMIGSLINKCLSKAENNARNQVIYLTGGGLSYIRGAKDYLSKLLGVNVEILVPPDMNYQKPNYSEVLGLLNYAVKKEKTSENKFIAFIKNIFKKN